MDSEVLRKFFYNDTKKIIENENILRIRKWKILKSEYPFFVISMQHGTSKKEYCFRFECNDFPISLMVVDSTNFLPLPHSEWPSGGYFLNGHSITQGPFLCAPGIREYHTHSSHAGESQWIFTSPEFRLPSVLDTVYSHFLKANC